MHITFNLPQVFHADADKVENAYALRALLDCLININIAYLRIHETPDLYHAGVKYGRTQLWESIPALYARGYGDCKSLTAALVAERRLEGFAAEPVFRFNSNVDGSTDYHILVRTNDGYEDPSKVLGMGQDENARFYPQLVGG